jgi:ABC-2 type transport system ATP-binding protein
MNLFEAEHIVKSYAQHVALQDVSIAVPKQSIFGLLGPNGAGKTSLIRIINQITGPDEGKLFFEGEQLQPKHVERIGYLPEERGLYKKMKVGEQAMYLAQLKGMDKSEAKYKLREWFKKFEIAGWWDKKVEELSKGMAQKVQFIVTVLHEPQLLILDEPFSGFDPINTNRIKKEILELRDKGATVIFSTHNMESVEEICDHIALIHQSKKILDGSMKAVKEAHKTRTYEVVFSGNMISFTNALWTGCELLDSWKEEELQIARIRLMGETTINGLLQAIIPHVEVKGLREMIPSMNEIFIQEVQQLDKAGSDE